MADKTINIYERDLKTLATQPHLRDKPHSPTTEDKPKHPSPPSPPKP